MTDPNSHTCPRCGASFPLDLGEGPCPACLIALALRAPAATTVPGTRVGAETADPSASYPRAFGGYRLLGLLGQGGMGRVYEAEHLASGRRVALKMLEQRLDSPELRQRFLREGRLAARVNHPNSLYVFGSEEIEDTPVITMEIAGGGTLEDRLEKRGAFPVMDAVDAMLDVIAGLEAASTGGVLHRDVKPANCFVGPDGSVKVGDYGLSVSMLVQEDTLVTAPGVIMGTPAYAPPEQLRGDDLDRRADIYSVGATLFALLTGRPPFEGKNAVQVVANAVNQDPKPVREVRDDVPPGLDLVVMRCLAKEPEGRYDDYATLRDALLPFSSKEPEPASIVSRVSAGWIDYLIAFMPPYLVLMFTVGAEALLVQPLVERTLFSFRYYLLLLACAFLYFVVLEGIWGSGVGKRLRGLQVIRPGGKPPGIGRALVRVLVPIASVELVRIPLSMTFITGPDWTGFQTAMFVLSFVVCGWIPALLALRARRENGYATLWDRLSGTRVVVMPKGSVRAAIESAPSLEPAREDAPALGPYRIVGDVASGAWILASDPVLRRPAWLLRRRGVEPSPARRDVARPGRPRWLQKAETDEGTWDAYEAQSGLPFGTLAKGDARVPWGTLRHWLHDLATELWAASRDKTLPTHLSLDHVWITATGHALLLDEPWPEVGESAELIAIETVEGQQRFLDAVAASVETVSLPLHARPLLLNLRAGRFEKLSFFTGTLRGLLDRPATVGRWMRAGSIFLVPLYAWIAVFVGRYHDKPSSEPLGGIVWTTVWVLLAVALIQLLEVPFQSSIGHQIFRLAVVDENGERASRARLLARWAIVWLPLLVPMALLAWLHRTHEVIALIAGAAVLLLWLGAAVLTVRHPNRGPHDRRAGTWVVRR